MAGSATQQRPRRPGRLVREPAEVSPGLKGLIDRVNGPAWTLDCGGTGDGKRGQRPLPAAPRLGDSFRGPSAQRTAQPLVLNLARADVKEYIFGVLDKLAGEYNIRYFKWT